MAQKNPAGLSDKLYKRYQGFPDDLTYDDFLGLDETTREVLVQRNRVLQTDTYNRTMGHAKGADWSKEETYVLQMRRAPRGYLIVNGVRKTLEHLFRLPISENEVNFANDFYRTKASVPYFNRPMWDSVLQNNGALPIEIDSVQDGTAVLASDPIMRVCGPGELAAHFEPDYHRIFYPSLVATDAHVISRTIGAHRFAEFGKRGGLNEELHMTAVRSMLLGGGIDRTSNDAAVAANSDRLWDAGTIGHRFIQFAVSEEAAFRKGIESLEKISLLIDLIDSKQGIDLACKLKKEYRPTGKKIWLRLDSGGLESLMDQAIYALHLQQSMGMTDPDMDKIIIEDLSSIDDMIAIDNAVAAAGFDPRKFIVYGAGSLITTKDKSRGDASTGFKLSAVEKDPRMKFSNSPGKSSLPGTPTLTYDLTQGTMIAQVGEFPDAEDYLIPASRPGHWNLLPDTINTFRKRLDATFDRIRQSIGKQSERSPRTKEYERALRSHYGLK